MDSCNIEKPSGFENCITGLSLKDLLKLKHSVEYFPWQKESGNRENVIMDNSCNEKENCRIPQALPLTAENREYPSSSDFQYGHYEIEEKPSRLQTIFHVSITALAFLAFGGYLLCLIVQAIKNKGKLMYLKPMVSSTMSTNAVNGVRGIKVYRRSRRSTTTPRSALSETTKATNNYNNEPYYFYMKKMK